MNLLQNFHLAVIEYFLPWASRGPSANVYY